MNRLLTWSFCFAIPTLIFGCTQGVREDRTIEFSRDGVRVAFQNREDGVFIASADGQGLTKIFQPDISVLATSRPLSSPTDGRLIFATAQSLEDLPQVPDRNDLPLPAEGGLAWPIPVRMTCWLRSEDHAEQPAEVQKLFEAKCGHLGYVSGGLAVRWHPDGQHVLYCAELVNDPTRHSVFEFDLKSGQTRQLFPGAANAVIFDWSPGGSYLVCVTGDDSHDVSGIWIGSRTDEKSWWRVPNSDCQVEGQFSSLIEQLRASRPAWTSDEVRCAFVSRSAMDESQSTTQRLQVIEMDGRSISPFAESNGKFSDLHWSPDGTYLGYIERDKAGYGILCTRNLDGHTSTLSASESIRTFAGFDSSGDQIAYVVTSRSASEPAGGHWALLLQPTFRRDSVMITTADLSDAAHQILSGMQVTFPMWSPTEDRLSLWLTFVPRYESLFSRFARVGMWPGDPAAIIETRSAKISWMAVSPQEELQIGHYLLMKGDPEQAWDWYLKARRKLPASKRPENWEQCLRRAGAPERPELFEAICLKRLGRDAEAIEKWKEFESKFYPPESVDPLPQQPSATAASATEIQDAPHDPVMKSLFLDMLIAEVFLSVEGLDEAITHFRKKSEQPQSDSVELSRATVLAQLLLIRGDHSGYLLHATNVLAPLAIKLWQSEQAGQAASPLNETLKFAVGSCLVPLFCTEYLQQISGDELKQQQANWMKFAAGQDSGLPAAAIDLVLRAFSKRLNDVAGAERAERRLAANPAAAQLFAGQSIHEWTRSLLPTQTTDKRNGLPID